MGGDEPGSGLHCETILCNNSGNNVLMVGA